MLKPDYNSFAMINHTAPLLKDLYLAAKKALNRKHNKKWLREAVVAIDKAHVDDVTLIRKIKRLVESIPQLQFKRGPYTERPYVYYDGVLRDDINDGYTVHVSLFIPASVIP